MDESFRLRSKLMKNTPAIESYTPNIFCIIGLRTCTRTLPVQDTWLTLREKKCNKPATRIAAAWKRSRLEQRQQSAPTRRSNTRVEPGGTDLPASPPKFQTQQCRWNSPKGGGSSTTGNENEDFLIRAYRERGRPDMRGETHHIHPVPLPEICGFMKTSFRSVMCRRFYF